MKLLMHEWGGTLRAFAGQWRQCGLLALCLFVVLGLPVGGRADSGVTNSVGMETNRMYIIDVRTEDEWNAGHIKDAILIPYDQISTRIAGVTTNRSASIALYCRSGRRSGIALKSLKALGYQNVENLGGLEDARKRLDGSP